MLLKCGVGEDSWESLGLQGGPTSPSQRRSVLGVHWKDWCWSWNSNTLATWHEELTHLKRPWCWERLRVGGEGDDRGWGGWMASPTQWTWVWVDSGSWWWTGRPGVLRSMGSQTVRHDWATELNWITHKVGTSIIHIFLMRKVRLKEMKELLVSRRFCRSTQDLITKFHLHKRCGVFHLFGNERWQKAQDSDSYSCYLFWGSQGNSMAGF